METTTQKPQIPPQHQDKQPGIEQQMRPRPIYIDPEYEGSNKLKDKVAIITGGDSGIGRAVAIAFSKEGADVVVTYLDEHEDAKETQKLVEESGRKCLLVAGDISNEQFCQRLISETIAKFGRLDVLVNNAAQQFPQESIEDIGQEQLEKTFRINIFSMFYTVKAALPHLKEGAHIINSTSVTAYRGSQHLLDYAATKGAITAYTRSLAQQLVKKGIYVNAVAPGPVWTPLIVSSFSADEVKDFGSHVPLQRPGQPSEIAPSYVFLASRDSSYMTGQVLHPNGGEIVNA
ncbi:MAG TPA: SDR family oxidoreductase [Methylophilaceae bacterium]|nr:SDR family oxidoreductase [Methylophilaceae bacterium]